jgi:hypothetical protein
MILWNEDQIDDGQLNPTKQIPTKIVQPIGSCEWLLERGLGTPDFEVNIENFIVYCVLSLSSLGKCCKSSYTAVKMAEKRPKTAKNRFFGTKTAKKYLSGQFFSNFRNLLIRPISLSKKLMRLCLLLTQVASRKKLITF